MTCKPTPETLSQALCYWAWRASPEGWAGERQPQTPGSSSSPGSSRSASSTASLTQAWAQLSPALAPASLLLERAALRQSLQAAFLALAAGPGRALGCPAPQLLTRLELLEQLPFVRAQHAQDLPRSRAQRQVELIEQLATHQELQLDQGAAQAARRLAGEWLDTFERWDWLFLGWQVLGCPEPAHPSSPPAVLGNSLPLLQALYCAAHDPQDLAYWAHARPPAEQPPGWAVGLSPTDPLIEATALTLWGPQAQVWPLQLASTAAPTGSAGLLALIWPELKALADLRLPNPQDPAHWPALADRRRAFQAAPGSTALVQGLSCLEASTPEAAARQALHTLQTWHGRGLDRIALVASDRLLFRRLQTLATEAGLLIHDPTGWALSTTVVAAALDGLLGLVLSPSPSRQALMAWLCNPVVLTALESQGLVQASELQDIHRRLDQHPNGSPFAQLPQPLAQGLQDCGRGLQQAAHGAGQVQALFQGLGQLGLLTVFQQDLAGQQLLGLLQQLAVGLQGQTLSPRLLRGLVLDALESQTLSLAEHEAPVRVMSLEQAARAQVQAVLVLGAAQGQFPPATEARLGDREEERLATARLPAIVLEAQFVSAFASLLGQSIPVSCLAVADDPGAPVSWAQSILRLKVFLPQPSSPPEQLPTPAAGSPVACITPPIVLPAASPPAVLPKPAEQPLIATRLPSQLSVTEAARYLECPARFHFEVVHQLKPLSLLPDEEPAWAFGNLAHAWLNWAAQPEQTAALAAVSSPAQLHDFTRQFLTWYQAQPGSSSASPRIVSPTQEIRLHSHAQAMLDWLRACAQEGHRVVQLEAPLQPQVLARTGIRLTGQPDRIDQTEAGLRRLIDFKTSRPEDLASQVKAFQARDPEAPASLPSAIAQVQIYAEMSARQQAPIHERLLVAISPTGAQALQVPVAAGLLDQLDQALAEHQQGQPYRRLGQSAPGQKPCQFCPMAGLCRPTGPDLNPDDEDISAP